MSTLPVEVTTFICFGALSLFASSLFVVRLERVGARLKLSEAVLGLLAAFGADAPEITSSITALVHHQRTVAIGVVLGSNIFNLAALLGLGALSAGRIALHRRVVVLSGVPALVVVVMTLALEHRGLGRWPVAAIVFGFVIPYTLMLESPHRAIRLLHLPDVFGRRLLRSVAEQEGDLVEAIATERGKTGDAGVALAMLAVVVGASIVMERVASAIGVRGHWSAFLLGGVVLAGVTSLPNAVAAIYLARHGRGAAALSTAMHSNIINVIVGLLLPALFIGIGPPTAEGSRLALWYLVMTLFTLAIAFFRKGIGKFSGVLIVLVYVFFLFTMIHN